MKIVHLILGKANPERMNGVNKVVYQLATQQVKHDKDCEVWGLTDDLDKNYGERNFETKLFLKHKSRFKITKELQYALKNSNSIFHIHGGWIPQFYAVAKFLTKHHKQYVITPHGAYNTIAMQRSSFVKKVYFKMFEKWMVENAKTIHCIGMSEKKGLEKLTPKVHQSIIPYGFSLDDKTAKRSTKNTTFTIGFVGRLDMYTKGLDLLIAAVKRMTNQSFVEVWIIGDGEDRQKLDQLISRNGLGRTVKVLGPKYNEEKNALIKMMDAFVHPSRNEGLPSAVIEACNFGVPSVVSRATNVYNQIIKHNAGFGMENEDVQELANSLDRLYELWANNKLSVMRTNAIHMVKNDFAWETLVHKFDALYT
jgi:glycosyltransferase involved in cell wall biosynthesis